MFGVTGNSSLPRLCCRFGLQRGRAPDTARSFFGRFESLSARDGRRPMSTASNVQQMTLLVSAGRPLTECLWAILHGFTLGVVAGKMLRATHER